MPTWRYTTGTKGINRVTAFERKDRDALYVEWWDDDGRHKRSLEYATGAAVPNTEEGRMIAVEVAGRMARAQLRRRTEVLGDRLGISRPRTVDELLAQLHDDKEAAWSEPYRRDQARYRAFWGERLGGLVLQSVAGAMVERIARSAARTNGWSPRTHGAYLRYVVDAFYYAERKLKWIGGEHNLSAVDIPSAKSTAPAFTVAEIRALLPALEAVDPRAGWIGHVAWQTGRRLSAIRTLTKGAVTLGEEAIVLRFPRSTDKARQEGEAAVVGQAAELTRQMLAKPGRYVLGSNPPSLDRCEKWMKEAVERAGIRPRPWLGWHSIKRRWATEAQGLVGREKQGGTSGATLDRIYVQDDLGPKVQLAERMAGALE